MKLCVYTAITGGKDNLKDFPKVEGVDYYCYSDEFTEAHMKHGWCCLPLTYKNECPILTAKYYKVNSHLLPEISRYETSLWVDASVTIPEKIMPRIACMVPLIGFMKHPVRNCAYHEAEEVRRLQLDSDENIDKTIKTLEMCNYPKDNGLHAGGFIVRKKNRKVEEFNAVWWYMIQNGSKRDQLSLDFTLWLRDLEPEEYEWGLVTIKRHNK